MGRVVVPRRTNTPDRKTCMETNVNYAAVGAFVIALVTTLVVIVIWLSSGLSREKFTTYKVYMNESVSGLSPDSSVEFNGVNVGSVRKMKINAQNSRQVILLLDIKSNTPITQGTRAKLDVRALTGMAYIQLVDKGTSQAPLKALPGKRYAVIPTTPSFLVRLDIALTRIDQSFEQISRSISVLLDQENLRSIKLSLANFQQITDVLVKESVQLNGILNNTANAARIFDTQTLPGTNQALQNFNAMTQDLSSVITEIKQNPAVVIRGKEPLPPGPGEK